MAIDSSPPHISFSRLLEKMTPRGSLLRDLFSQVFALGSPQISLANGSLKHLDYLRPSKSSSSSVVRCYAFAPNWQHRARKCFGIPRDLAFPAIKYILTSYVVVSTRACRNLYRKRLLRDLFHLFKSLR